MSKTEKLPTIYVGVDLHKTQFTVSAITKDAEVLHERAYRTDTDDYRKFCGQMHQFEEKFGCVIKLALEATGNARFFKNLMESEGFSVVVVNTNKFKVISSSTKKTDANDAATLAFYLMKDMLPEAHLCDQTSNEIRRVLKTRSILVSSTVRIKNQIHGMCLDYGIVTKSAQFQSKRARQQIFYDLEDHHFSEFAASSLKVMFDSLDNLHANIKQIEKQLAEMVKNDETVELLLTVPGIGLVTATTIAAYTKNIERFGGDFKKFASYLGIVPGVHNSNESVRLGKITKRGPQDLRTAFVQVALGMIRQPKKTQNWKLMSGYKQMKENKGSGRAIIATTRKIARIVFAMLQTGSPFNPSLMLTNTR